MRTIFLILVIIFLTACSQVDQAATGVSAPTQPPTNPAPTSQSVEPASPTSPDAPTTAAPANLPATAEPASNQDDQVQVVPSGFPNPENYLWQPIVSGLDSPIGIASAYDGSGRVFVIEQPGMIRIITNNTLNPQAFLDIRDRVGSQGSEQGLLGLAFHPDYQQNGTFYVNYTDRGGTTHISLFTAA